MNERDLVHRDTRPWTRGPGIQGRGIGERLVQGRPAGELSLRVYVAETLPLSDGPNPVPRRVPIPEVGEATTDVVQIGPLALERFRERVRRAGAAG